MYNIFYIYTYKYTKPSNTLTLSLSQRPYKPRTHKRPNEPHPQTQNASRVYMGKMHKLHNAPSHMGLAICTYAAILKNCIMCSVFSFVFVL